MLKESTGQQLFEMIEEFFPLIIQTIRKDLRKDHLKNDKEFLKIHFGGRNPNKLSVDDLVEGYAPLLKNGNDELWDFFSERWLGKRTEMYYFFEEKLKELAEDFTEMDEMDASFARKLAQEAEVLFGARDTYIFAVMNAVVFPKEIYDDLGERARHKEEVVEVKAVQGENLEAKYQREIRNIQSKYEKKLLGFQKKYERDVAALKKQVGSLQRKLAAFDES